ncbi:MAG: 2-dehydropantoate 2-reductase [Gammaproteobacteria bacterium]|nr:MAG: 2-dehydropantoate 2-reductase [Pseudomonadota bacterium]PIE38401.1 MAG: 2-dehydropantoate 2-reductase [Gammaproteobacteria bacterium]
MKIAIFGAGSIGCYLGGCLVANGANVAFIGRPRIQQELTQYGLSVSDWQGRKETCACDRFTFSDRPEACRDADFILVTVKSPDTTDAAIQLGPHIKQGAVVASFQNGIRNADLLRKHIKDNPVLTGMVSFNVSHTGNGRFHCGTEGYLALESRQDIEKPLVRLLDSSGLPCQACPEMKSVQWGKLIMNLNNPVNALAGIPLIEELEQRKYRKVLAASIREALEVLKQAGIKPARIGKVPPSLMPAILELPSWLFKLVARAMLKIDPQATSSMQEDLVSGRKTEVDYLNGEIITLGEKSGLQCPVNRKIVALVKESESGRSGSPKLSARRLLDAVVLQDCFIKTVL